MIVRDGIIKMVEELIYDIEYRELREPDFVGFSAKEIAWQLRQLRDRIYNTFPHEGLPVLPDRELEIFQSEVGRWAERNFGATPSYRPLLGAVEEIGELAHAHLKKEQGIREGLERFEQDAADAIGDILVYLADYCARTGLSLQESVDKTWARVRQRDWKKYPGTGRPPIHVQGEFLPLIKTGTVERGDAEKK